MTTTADPAGVNPPPPERGAPVGGKKEAARIREVRALELRMAGATFAAIAQALGYSHRKNAQRAVERAMRREQAAIAPDREAFVQMHLMRTERLIQAHWRRATGGDPAATETIRRLLERQARLMGLDKPVRFEVTDAMDAEIEGLLAEMERLTAEQARMDAAAALEQEVQGDGQEQDAAAGDGAAG